MSEIAQWTVACIMVIMYAHQRFSTPVTNCYSTTTARYYVALTVYVTSIGILFVFLGGGLAVSPKVWAMFVQGGENLPSDIQELPGPLLAALLLTTFLPNSPFLKRFDGWLRRGAWRLGRIPREAQQLAVQMRRSRLVVPEDYRKSVVQRLAAFGVTEEGYDWEAEGDERTLVERLVEVTYLVVLTRDWKLNDVRNWTRRKYDKVIDTLVEDYNATRIEYEQLIAASREHFEALKSDGNELSTGVEQRLGTALAERAENLKRVHCELVARGVLRREGTWTERHEKLEQIGFSGIEEPQRPIAFNDILRVCLGVFSILFFPMIGLVVWGASDGRISQAFMIPFMVAIIYGFAIFAAIFPKTTWSFADIRKVKQRPVVAYFLSGLLAMCFAAMVSMVFRYLGSGGNPDFIKALESFWWTHPWLGMSFVTAMTLAWLADDHVLDERPPNWRQRLVEALVMAALLACTAYIVYLRLEEVYRLATEEDIYPWWMVNRSVPHWFAVRPPEFLVPVSAAIGFLLGYMVPHLHRTTSTAEEAGEIDADRPRNVAQGAVATA